MNSKMMLLLAFVASTAAFEMSMDESPGDEVEAPMGEEAPMGHKTPTGDGEMPMDEESPMEYETPMDGKAPMDYETPMDGGVPMDYETPMDGEMPMDEEAPMDYETPMDGEAPMGHKAPMGYEAPMDHKAPMDVNETPMDDETPMDHKTPMRYEAPMDHKTPMGDEAPMDHKAPMDDEAPMDHKAPMDDEAPMDHKTPMADEAPVDHKSPTDDEAPMDAPVDAPVDVDETPAPTPMPTPEPTPAPPTYCSSNKLCTANGDTAATCVDGKCVCSTGFEILTVDGAKLEKDGCYAEGTDLATVRLTRFITIRFGAGVFSRLSPAARNFLLSFLRALFNLLNSIFREGSILVGASGDVSVADAAGLEPAALTAKWAEEVKGAASVNDVFGDPSLMTVEVAGEGASDCPAAVGVAEQLKLGDECIPFECATGYTLSSADPPVCEVPVVARDSDDDIHGGEYVGFVVGGFIVIAVIGGLVYFMCFRQKEAPAQVDQTPVNDPYKQDGDEV